MAATTARTANGSPEPGPWADPAVSAAYTIRRSAIEHYFDRTAADTWARLTSDAPVGGIRATVRAGRDRMRTTLLDWLPADLSGARVLDAGCGTGMLAIELARRGADVLAIDLSRTLTDLARERASTQRLSGRVTFLAGDMLDPAAGRFDYAVAMDSLIHYDATDAVGALAHLSARVDRSIVFTFAPRTTLLAVAHAIGQLFPRGHRSPAIEPVAEASLRAAVANHPAVAGWSMVRTARVTRGFYTSQAAELSRGTIGRTN